MGFRPVSRKEKQTLQQIAQSLDPVFSRQG